MPITLPQKPKFREPCNGCGLCCTAQLCEVGKLAFPEGTLPCPALSMSSDKTRTVCMLVRMEIDHGLEPILQKSLGIGMGCSMEDK